MSDHPTSDAPAQNASANPAQAQTDNGNAAPVGDASAQSGEQGSAHGAGTGSQAGQAASDAQTAQTAMTERIGQLEAEKAQLEKEKQDHWERLLRTTAELDNVRKRGRRELDDARTEARTRVLREMLPVIDNLERALEHADTTNAGNQTSVIEGVKLVLRQFAQALERCDVRPVETVGKPFDPNLHEAISQIETAEQPPGSVVQALQKGYMIGERLLRPALVVVAKAPPEPGPVGPNGSGAGHDGAHGDAEGGKREA